MTVFISWSGNLSQEVAAFLSSWIEDVLQGVRCWYSADDIDKGSIWYGAIEEGVSSTRVGVICLTRENMNAPWILFEAGALSKGLTKARVCPLLIDLTTLDVTGPLSHFNLTMPNAEDMMRLLKTINASSDNGLDEARLERSFERWWPEFLNRFAEILKNQSDKTPQRPRHIHELLSEILETTRTIQRALPATTQSAFDEARSAFTKGPAVSVRQEVLEATDITNRGRLVITVVRDSFTATGSGKMSPHLRDIPWVSARLDAFPDGYRSDTVRWVVGSGTVFDFNITLKSTVLNRYLPLGDYIFSYHAKEKPRLSGPEAQPHPGNPIEDLSY